MLTFNEHLKITQGKAQKRNNVLKVIAGSSWGKDKETLITTFKAVCQSVINYAAPIWAPQASKTNMQKLQIAQNKALRAATGCHVMSSIYHLHEETKVIPVTPHNEMLSKQYLLGCLLPSDVYNDIISAPQPPRSIRKNRTNTYLQELRRRYLPENNPFDDIYKTILRQIHTDTISDVTEHLTFNRVLGTRPPDINDEEKKLPRPTRVTLAQLRSGWCHKLQSYKARLNPEESDQCPACRNAVHDVPHLFNCVANPTTPDPSSLLTNPVAAAEFLNILMKDSVTGIP
ncbi:hypothetical protein M8J77_020912 [Diaphorina citri]|nr:hypothetical protein M8J77_020912 [Diaphorina citri]